MRTITYDPATHVLVPRQMTDEMHIAAQRMKGITAYMWEAALESAPEVEPQPQQRAVTEQPCLVRVSSISGRIRGVFLAGYPFDYELKSEHMVPAIAYGAATPAPAVDAASVPVGHFDVNGTPAGGKVIGIEVCMAAYDLAPGRHALHVIPVAK